MNHMKHIFQGLPFCCTKEFPENHIHFYHFCHGGETHFLVLAHTLIYDIMATLHLSAGTQSQLDPNFPSCKRGRYRQTWLLQRWTNVPSNRKRLEVVISILLPVRLLTGSLAHWQYLHSTPKKEPPYPSSIDPYIRAGINTDAAKYLKEYTIEL